MNAHPATTTVPPGIPWASQDDTTRYLCAAAHLDSRYADDAIREFVVEPTRPIPPSPGFRPDSVLAEAIAARIRRKLRDSTLALLMAAFVAMTWSSWLLYGWIGVAVVVAIPAALRKLSGGRLRWPVAASAMLAVIVVGALVVVFLGGGFDDIFGSSFSDSSYYGGYGYYGGHGSSSGDILVGLSTIPLLLMLVVLLADRVAVWNLLTERFGSRNVPPTDPFAPGRRLLEISPVRFRAHLERHRMITTQASGGTPLIVHRGYNPFVGAGLRRESWSMVLPLEKLDIESKPDGSPLDELTTVLLYERVREAISVLQNSKALSPGRRLRDLRILDAVYVSSRELIDHLHDPASLAYLPDPDRPPHTHLPAAEAEALRGEPREWARYYLCFEVETWDRDLVMSSFLHAAVDGSTLYLEWTPCVLPPIRDTYRQVDKLMPGFGRPVRQALVRLLKLPVTIIGRTAHAVTPIRPLPRKPGRINSDAYGNLRTLREMAAATDVDSYFQLVDVERYEKILHSRLIPAISQVLRGCGYSPAQFERQAQQVINNTFIGDINGPVNTGVVHGNVAATTVVTEQEATTQ